MHGGNHELRVVDIATAVHIYFVEQGHNLLVGHSFAIVLNKSFFDLFN